MEVGHQRELATPLLLSSTGASTDTESDAMPDSLTQRTPSSEAGSPAKTSTSNSTSNSHHHLNALEIDASSLDQSQELPGSTDSNAEDEEVPLDPHAVGGGDLQSAVLGVIKAMVGPAILYLPHGFVAAGYLVALPIMIAATVLYLHSSKCLLEVWKYESEKQLLPQFEEEEEELSLQVTDSGAALATERPNHNSTKPKTVAVAATRRSLSYPDLAYRAFGTRGETMVKVGIALMQSVRKLCYCGVVILKAFTFIFHGFE